MGQEDSAGGSGHEGASHRAQVREAFNEVDIPSESVAGESNTGSEFVDEGACDDPNIRGAKGTRTGLDFGTPFRMGTRVIRRVIRTLYWRLSVYKTDPTFSILLRKSYYQGFADREE